MRAHIMHLLKKITQVGITLITSRVFFPPHPVENAELLLFSRASLD